MKITFDFWMFDLSILCPVASYFPNRKRHKKNSEIEIFFIPVG
jgi:hypothetical protein